MAAYAGIHTAALLTLSVRGRLGVDLAGTIFGHESFVYLTIIYLSVYK